MSVFDNILRRLVPALSVVALSLAVACDGGGHNAIPRRTAYPRVQLCDTVYDAVEWGGMRLSLNSGATVSVDSRVDGTGWINVAYPGYGAVVRLTLSFPADIAAVMDNRMQRIGLNAGDSPTAVTRLSGHGVDGIIVEAPGAAVTPLQLLATDHSRYVLSGAVEFTDTVSMSDAEARRPVVDALRRDMIHLIESL